MRKVLTSVLLVITAIACLFVQGCAKGSEKKNGSPTSSGEGGGIYVPADDGSFTQVPIEWDGSAWGDSWEPKD